jgi:hypothetical protein
MHSPFVPSCLPDPPAAASARLLPAVVRREAGITNTLLPAASKNGNGNGKAVSPEDAKVGVCQWGGWRWLAGQVTVFGGSSMGALQG